MKPIFKETKDALCPDCGAPKKKIITKGGLFLGETYDCTTKNGSCAYDREIARQKNIQDWHEDQVRKERLRLSGMSKAHLEIVDSVGFDNKNFLVNTVIDYFKNGGRHWLFLMAASGTGKTTALHWLGRTWIVQEGLRVAYFIHGNLIDDMRVRGYTQKITIQDLLSFDAIIIDDFFKSEECQTSKVQDQTKRLMDMFIAEDKRIVLGADASPTDIYMRLGAEYKAQITGRINQSCGPNGRWIIGKNDLPDLRLKKVV